MKKVLLSQIIDSLESGSRPKGGVNGLIGEIPSLGAEHLNDEGGFNFEKLKLIQKDFYRCLKNGRIRQDDILIVKDGATTGKVSYVNADFPFREAAINEHLFKIQINKKDADPAYVFYYLKSVPGQHQILKDFRGATVGGISRGFVDKVEIPYTNVTEQKRITAILDKANSLRRKRQQAIQLAEEFLWSVFLDMFGDPVLNPKGWPEKKLNQVSEIASGVTKGRNFVGKRTIFVPYMRVANVQDGHINIDDVQKIEVLDTEVEKYRLKEGDILLTEGGDPDKLGRGAVWRGVIDPCIHQNHIFRVRTDNKKIIPEYLSTLIGSARGKRYFLKAAKQTTGVASINKTQLSNFPVIVPPLAIQNEYLKMVNRINTLIDKEKVKNKHLEKLFGSLLQSAFRGDL